MFNSFKPKVYHIILTLFLSGCNWGRTPSNIRFAKNCYIEFPSDILVITDQYDGMVADYAINYVVKFSQPEMSRFTFKIRHLNKNYTSPPSNENESIIRLLIKQYKEGVWYKYGRGYQFYRQMKGTTVSAFIDTVNEEAEFNEFGQ